MWSSREAKFISTNISYVIRSHGRSAFAITCILTLQVLNCAAVVVGASFVMPFDLLWWWATSRNGNNAKDVSLKWSHVLPPCLHRGLLSYDWDERTGLSREHHWNISARHLGQNNWVIKNMIVAMAIRGKYRCNVLTDEDTSDTAGLNYSKWGRDNYTLIPPSVSVIESMSFFRRWFSSYTRISLITGFFLLFSCPRKLLKTSRHCCNGGCCKDCSSL